jgi:hypothetical protein
VSAVQSGARIGAREKRWTVDAFARAENCARAMERGGTAGDDHVSISSSTEWALVQLAWWSVGPPYSRNTTESLQICWYWIVHEGKMEDRPLRGHTMQGTTSGCTRREARA